MKRFNTHSPPAVTVAGFAAEHPVAKPIDVGKAADQSQIENCSGAAA